MSDHPWCKDVARDEAVRAAEDAVERPAVPDWREIPERVAALEREVAAMRAPVEAEAERLRDRLTDAEHRCDGYKLRVIALVTERDTLKARVAELESQAKLAPTANGGAGSNQADAEPVAWMFVARQTNEIPPGCAQSQAKNFALKTGGTVVPLYRSPPQPRGWLTAEEREAVETARDHFDDDDHGDAECDFIARVLKQLLARNSPPKVRLPSAVHKDILAALAAAGVEVEE